jgi:D-beta-D-heptose 7-phosphate kinase/D-beta-D-heptose 1-phosphate adenosyltransferase
MPIPPAKRRRLLRLISSFEGKRILVVGDFMLDCYIRGSASRISPEAPVPVVEVSQETFVAGGAGNVAHNLSSLGARVETMGVIGNDEAGRRLVALLRSQGVSACDLVVDHERVTSQKCRVIAERQQAVRYDRETSGPLSPAAHRRLMEHLPDAIRSSQAVILSDYGKGVISPSLLKEAISQARHLGLPITVDPKIEHFRSYQGVTCLTPNLQEAWAGMHRPSRPGEKNLLRLGRDILAALKSNSLLITRSSNGMTLFERGGRILHIPTQAREVFDVIGAGDTVIATLTLALACGASLEQAAVISNHAAGIVVGKLGTAVVTPTELAGSLR